MKAVKYRQIARRRLIREKPNSERSKRLRGVLNALRRTVRWCASGGLGIIRNRHFLIFPHERQHAMARKTRVELSATLSTGSLMGRPGDRVFTEFAVFAARAACRSFA